jgi:hypothetical protein
MWGGLVESDRVVGEECFRHDICLVPFAGHRTMKWILQSILLQIQETVWNKKHLERDYCSWQCNSGISRQFVMKMIGIISINNTKYDIKVMKLWRIILEIMGSDRDPALWNDCRNVLTFQAETISGQLRDLEIEPTPEGWWGIIKFVDIFLIYFNPFFRFLTLFLCRCSRMKMTQSDWIGNYALEKLEMDVYPMFDVKTLFSRSAAEFRILIRSRTTSTS